MTNGTNSAALIRKYVLLNFPYFIIFWLAGKVGQAYRIAPGADVSEKVLGLSQGFAVAFDNMAPSFHPQDLLVGIIGAIVIWFVVWNKKKNAKKFRKDAEHGSARWSA
jgi:type IV secretion system protein VirD4